MNPDFNRLIKATIFIQKITNDSIITKTIIQREMDSLKIDPNAYYFYKDLFDTQLEQRKKILQAMLMIEDSLAERNYLNRLYHKSLILKDSLYHE